MRLSRNRRRAKQQKARNEAKKQQWLASSVSDDELRRLRRVESDYNRERLHDSFARNLQQMLYKADAPESQWWMQYMLMATVRIIGR